MACRANAEAGLLPRVMRWPRLLSASACRLWEIVLLSVVIQWGMMPILAQDFHRVSLAGPLSNIPAVILTGLIVPLGFLTLLATFVWARLSSAARARSGFSPRLASGCREMVRRMAARFVSHTGAAYLANRSIFRCAHLPCGCGARGGGAAKPIGSRDAIRACDSSARVGFRRRRWPRLRCSSRRIRSRRRLIAGSWK